MMRAYSPCRRPVEKYFRVLLISFLNILLLGSSAAIPDARAAEVALAWDASSDTNVAGYKVYVGTSSRNYTAQENAGKVYSYTFANLQDGTTFYFAATAYDSYGNESDYSEEVVYTTAAANHVPVAESGTLSMTQDTTATGTLMATDSDNDVLTFGIVAQGTRGTVTVTDATSGAYSYTPNSGVLGSDSFTFKVTDPRGLSSSATVSVTILALNHAPEAQSSTLLTKQDLTATGILKATDQDGDALTYGVASQGTIGTVTITNASTGVYSYTPKTGVFGNDSFTFIVSDAKGLSSSATVVVIVLPNSTILPSNKAPLASNGSLSTIQNISASGKFMATDADGDTLTYGVVSYPTRGSLSFNAATGSFTYTPDGNHIGTDTFTFKVNDGKADSNIASITVTISAHVTVRLEAERGSLTAPMVAAKNSSASGGKFIWVPNGKGSIEDSLQAGGQAVYSFEIPTAGNYRVWGRVSANSVGDNSFFISMDDSPSIAWYTAVGGKDSWVWDQVSDPNDASAGVFYLTAGLHTLIVKQMEDGTKLDSLVITTQPTWIAETVYCDAESGGIEGWDVFDASPTGSTITNVNDAGRGGQVIQVAGSKTNNGYRLRTGAYSEWSNTNQFVIKWSMEYKENFIVYVEVQTTSGYRYFQYEPVNNDALGNSNQIRLGLGAGAKNGQWHTFVRDLQADLAKAQPGAAILAVNSFSVRGSGKIDDVKLRSTM